MTDPYDIHAAWYHTHRDTSLTERPWLDHLTANLAPSARILDLGCGTGRPIAEHLKTSGFHVTGLDRSPAMLAIARDHIPSARFIQADMRDFPVSLTSGPKFDAILSWDGFFHLTQSEQRAALPHICGLLAPNARLLLTVGPEAGDVTGQINGNTVHHSSLSAEDYAYILAASGVSLLLFSPNDEHTTGHSILLAQKTT